MKVRLLAIMVLVAALSACATVPTTTELLVGPNLRLVDVDGRPAAGRAFHLQFTADGYAATYDCNAHFGTYDRGAGRLVLRPGATSGGTCDQVDLRTRARIVYDRSLVNLFFSDPVFQVNSRPGFLELRNSRRAFTFLAVP